MLKTTKRLVVKTKKAKLLQLLEAHGGNISLADAAKEVYGSRSRLAQERLERALAAYRMKDVRFTNIRVRGRRLVRADAAQCRPGVCEG